MRGRSGRRPKRGGRRQADDHRNGRQAAPRTDRRQFAPAVLNGATIAGLALEAHWETFPRLCEISAKSGRLRLPSDGMWPSIVIRDARTPPPYNVTHDNSRRCAAAFGFERDTTSCTNRAGDPESCPSYCVMSRNASANADRGAHSKPLARPGRLVTRSRLVRPLIALVLRKHCKSATVGAILGK